jgi:hypothetical protein
MNAASPERRPATEEISGVIERVTFHNEENGFCVLRVKTQGHRDETTVIGSLPSVTAGEWLVANGWWVRDKEHGLQFKASVMKTVPPTTAEGIERYFGSGLVKGIGPILAKKLVGRFGAEVLAVIENRAAELQSVDGIGPKRRERIAHAWHEAKQVREIMLFLRSHGVSTSRAVRIFKTYGEQAIEKVGAIPTCWQKTSTRSASPPTRSRRRSGFLGTRSTGHRRAVGGARRHCRPQQLPYRADGFASPMPEGMASQGRWGYMVTSCWGHANRTAHRHDLPVHGAIIDAWEVALMKRREGYKRYVIEARSCELKDGGFSAEFSVEEHDASGVTETQFYLPDTFPTQESTIKAAIKAGRQKLDMAFERGSAVVNGWACPFQENHLSPRTHYQPSSARDATSAFDGKPVCWGHLVATNWLPFMPKFQWLNVPVLMAQQ